MLILNQRGAQTEVQARGRRKSRKGFSCCRSRAAQFSNGTSSSDVASSDRGISSTSSSEDEDDEEEEKEGEADRGRTLLEEEEDV